jgi:hypothetical protein
MKISKIAISALFAAGFITSSAAAGFADEKPQIYIYCIDGYTAVYSEDGSSGSCEAEAEVYVDDPRPIDSCWETEDGTNVCARGGRVPMPANGEEETPIDPTSCMITTDADGNVVGSCEDIVLYDKPAEDGGLGGGIPDSWLRDDVDETLMYQSGVAMSGSDNSSSNALAAFGVLVGALGALGIGLSRQKDAK